MRVYCEWKPQGDKKLPSDTPAFNAANYESSKSPTTFKGFLDQLTSMPEVEEVAKEQIEEIRTEVIVGDIDLDGELGELFERLGAGAKNETDSDDDDETGSESEESDNNGGNEENEDDADDEEGRSSSEDEDYQEDSDSSIGYDSGSSLASLSPKNDIEMMSVAEFSDDDEEQGRGEDYRHIYNGIANVLNDDSDRDDGIEMEDDDTDDDTTDDEDEDDNDGEDLEFGQDLAEDHFIDLMNAFDFAQNERGINGPASPEIEFVRLMIAYESL